MGKIYINCARCGKDLECEELDDVYTSKIDDTFLCKECFEEEKPEYIQQLKQQLAEKDKEINSLIVDYEKRISQEQELMSNMEHRLTEKDNLIEFGKEEIRKRNKRIDEIVERDKKLFDNKNKEIECLNKRIDRYENMFRSRIKRTGNIQKDIELYVKQLAIQELEKVKELLLDEYKKYPIVYDKTNDIVAGALDRDKVNEIIDQQIKELKGEKNDNY